MRTITVWLHCSLLLLALTIGATRLSAQLLLGAISGTVTDSSGALVPGAMVKVIHTATNLTIKVESSKDGAYLAPNLPIGAYTVTFSKEGFKTLERREIIVEGNRTTTVNGVIEPGSVATTVEVAATPMLNQTDTTTGYVLDEHAINNTPLGTGSFTQLAILSPGVSADFLSGSGTNSGLGNQSIWANGQRDTSNSVSVNGVYANNLFNGKTTSSVASARFTANTGAFTATGYPGDNETNTSVYDSVGQGIPTPAPEMLQELRVNTAMYDAAQGGKSGAHIEVTTRSGTNQYHGQVFEHLQNSAFNAAPFFRNASTAVPASDKVPKLHYNRFGGTLGGPIKHDKLFFFAGYQGVSAHDAMSGSTTFSVPLHLTDDRSATALANLAQQDFGRTILPSQIDPAAIKLLNYKLGDNYLIPSAQISDAATQAKLGYDVFLQAPATSRNDQFSGSVDYIVSNADRLAFKLFYQRNPTEAPFSGSNTLGFPQRNQSGAHNYAIDNTTILTPNLTWEQKVGFVRMQTYVQTDQPLGPSDVGINVFNATQLPSINISTAASSALRGGYHVGSTFSNSNAGTFQNQLEGGTTLNWVHGVHIVYAGVNWDRNQLNIINRQNNVGSLSFSTFPDFLTGALTPSSTVFYLGSSNRYYRADLAGAFVEDKMRLSSTLNVSVGLRYDYSGPFREKYGLLTNFHPDAYQYNSASDTIVSTGLVVAGNNGTLGTPGVSDSTLTGRQWGFGPRVGIAWTPAALKRVVVRAGFGMFYDRGEYFTELSPGSGANGVSGPFGITLAPPFINRITATSTGTLSNPFLGANIPAPVTSQTAFAGLVKNIAQLRTGAVPYIFGGYDPANVLPYTENWTLDLQWQPTNSVQMTLGYVGNRSLHQVMPIPFNQAGLATPDHPINGEIYSYGFNVVPVESLKTFNGGNTDLRVPYTGFDDNSVFYKSEGIASYHALQFGLRKRLSKGLSVIGSYTWSHTLDEQSGLGLYFNGNNPFDPRSSYGTATYDRTHVLAVHYYYEFPHVASGHKWLGRAANGWRLNGVTIFQSGFPYNAYDFSGSVAGIYYSQFVNIIDPVLPLKPGVTVKQATLQGSTGYDINKPFVDPNAFYLPQFAPGTNGVPPCATVNGKDVCDTFESGFGATGRNTFRGPFQFRADVSAQKETRINERFRLRLQGDFFNVFNHPSFDAPTVGSAGLYTTSSAGVPTQRGFLSTFATVQRTIGGPRFIQLSLALLF